jgi:glutamyl-tRNA reductase
VSVSRANATVEQIEAACTDSQRGAIETLLARPAVAEAFCLQTCHRCELYVVTDDPATGQAGLAESIGAVPNEAVALMDHEESLEHLLRVAAGLESVVLGEDQILGQVRQAFADAQAVGAIGPILDEGLTKALHVGERARTETVINEGIVSLGSAAAQVAVSEGLPESATGLVVGAGEMGALAADAIEPHVDRLVVANRTRSRATALCNRVAGDTGAVSLDELPTAFAEADVLISATASPDPVVTPAMVRDEAPPLLIDLARPRDIDRRIDDIDGVTRYDLDTLEGVIDDTYDERRDAARAVETLVDAEFANLLEQYKRKRADQVIAAMYESAEHIKAREIRTTLSKLDGLDEDDQEVIAAMADSIVGQLLAAPTKSLREAAAEDDWATINSALQLFDPEFGSDRTSLLEGVRPEDLPEQLRGSLAAGEHSED